MSYPFEYRQNYIKDKDKYNLEALKRVISFNYDMIQVPRHGKTEYVQEQR